MNIILKNSLFKINCITEEFLVILYINWARLSITRCLTAFPFSLLLFNIATIYLSTFGYFDEENCEEGRNELC